MATTTNFGWETPDDTDLVKDGALAIRTLGNSIDTSLVDLKGGTTGQVLSKTSNTDMDFTWVTSDDANAIQNAIVDAKGDLIAASAADTPARLAVGNDGETLVADSSTSTGLRWSAGNPQGNPVLNSAMQIWQRGTSISLAASTSAANGFSADRWQTTTGANQACTISRQATGDSTNLPFIQYALRYQRNSGQTGTGALDFVQNLESINSIPYAGKTVTFSFYARAGANYSATSSLLSATLYSGTATDGNVLTSWSGTGTVAAGSATLTTTWQRFSYSGTVSATATQLALYFRFSPTGTAGAADFYEITGVQIDVGSVALPFRTYAATLAGELLAAQRYYWRTTATGNTFNAINGGVGIGQNANSGFIQIVHPVTMRTVPTAVEYGGTLAMFDGTGATTGLTIALDTASVDSTRLTVTKTGGFVANRPYMITAWGDANAYLGMTAEL